MRTPRQIAIEPTNECNLRCIGCPQKDEEYDGFHRGFMKWDLFKWIVDKIDFPTTIALWLNGEPLLHSDYIRMASYIDNNTDTPWTITTNGLLMGETKMEYLCESKNLYQVIFSIDGFHGGTFKSLRGVDLNVVKDKVFKLKAMRDRKNKTRDDFTIGVKLTEKGQDYQEIEQFIMYWLSLVDYVIVGKYLGRINEQSLRMFPCRYSDDMLLEIRWDGTIIPCSYHHGAAEKIMIDLGNVQDYDNLLEAYNSDKFKQFRYNNYHGYWPKPCDTCGFAYTGDGWQGKLSHRRIKLPFEVYYSEDYYNRVYSKEPPRGGTSRTRQWTYDEEIL